ncbi:50S ribosomal protein L16, chloroplastic, partial [Glycine soja]
IDENLKVTFHWISLDGGSGKLLKTKLAWITSRQIEAGQRAMSRNVRRGGQIWVHIFPDKPVIVRPTETCMGSGFQLLKYV